MEDVSIKLISQLDECTEEHLEVFATIESAGQEEFFKAAQSGFKSKYKVSLWQSDYEGQSIASVRGERLSIYRTYEGRDQKVELYLGKKAGVFE